jgi:hypothetical protein
MFSDEAAAAAAAVAGELDTSRLQALEPGSYMQCSRF